jgi:60 kDa SS-A/Ro ribonucleoprotein
MKDMPATLTAALSVLGPQWLAPTFQRVIDNGKMLRNFVQIMRSGVLGRKSLGTLPKRLVREWLNGASDEKLVEACVGQAPSLADVVKMVHPKPVSPAREALYGYVIGRPHDATLLPQALRDYEVFKAGSRDQVASVPFQLLTSLELGRREWVEIARNAPWQMTRMNLNTFARHGVFEVSGMAEITARRLSHAELVVRARAMPYR